MPQLERPLYQRCQDYIPRIGAVHDLCGYGKCSLGVAIPVLSAAGCDVCPLPTSLFSAHTKFPHFYMHDTTSMLADYMQAWKEEGLELDAVYSGFLGAEEQVDCIRELYNTHPKALRIVDPVMGDGGKPYPTYTAELCQAMGSLVEGADVLTPNLTEASILTGQDYQGQSVSDEEALALGHELCDMGAKMVVLKGNIVNEGKSIRNYIISKNQERSITADLLPFMLHGTGDLFCSSLLAALMCSQGLFEATDFAGRFVVEAMELSRKQPDFELRGVSFEPLLGKIAALLA